LKISRSLPPDSLPVCLMMLGANRPIWEDLAPLAHACCHRCLCG